MKKCTCNHSLVIHTQAAKFVAFVVLFMALSRLLELGLKFSSVVAQQGFTSSPHDIALFVRRSSAGITLILLYVDDMIITGNDSAGIRSLQHFLSQYFEMKDLGTLSYFLGLEVPHPLMDTIFPRLNMLLIFSPKPVSPTTRLFPLL